MDFCARNRPFVFGLGGEWKWWGRVRGEKLSELIGGAQSDAYNK